MAVTTTIVKKTASGAARRVVADVLFDSNYLTGGTTVATDVHCSYTDLGISYLDNVTGRYQEQYLIEYSISLADLGLTKGGDVSLSWALSCDNDIITATHNVSVPEPASMSILGVTGIALLARRRRPSRVAA